jgi:hypothetical protein
MYCFHAQYSSEDDDLQFSWFRRGVRHCPELPRLSGTEDSLTKYFVQVLLHVRLKRLTCL